MFASPIGLFHLSELAHIVYTVGFQCTQHPMPSNQY